MECIAFRHVLCVLAGFMEPKLIRGHDAFQGLDP